MWILESWVAYKEEQFNISMSKHGRLLPEKHITNININMLTLAIPTPLGDVTANRKIPTIQGTQPPAEDGPASQQYHPPHHHWRMTSAHPNPNPTHQEEDLQLCVWCLWPAWEGGKAKVSSILGLGPGWQRGRILLCMWYWTRSQETGAAKDFS